MSGSFILIGAIATHTPVWVFVLLAALVALGIQAMRPRVVDPRRMLITPLVFIVWGLVGLVAKPHFGATLVAEWAALLLCGLALGWSTTRLSGLRVDRATGRAHLPGSPALLVRVLLVFFVKYALNASMAMNPDMAGRLALWDVAVSGLMAGFFLGWLARFWTRYRTAPAPTRAIGGQAAAMMGVAE
jgi:hypothetical protein